jgi:hypothetical protein
MTGASEHDIDVFDAYGQSIRNCTAATSSAGGGKPPANPSDPNIYGVCVPATIAADADEAFCPGSSSPLCLKYGEGGCKTCSDYGFTCGLHVNNCQQTISCGLACACRCGGVYPRCLPCGPLPF